MTLPVRCHRIGVRIFVAGLAAAAYCLGQTVPADQKPIPVGCPQPVDFEHYMGTSTPYFVRDATVQNPFDFLPWVRNQQQTAEDDMRKAVAQKDFSYSTAVRQALDTLYATDSLPNATHVRFKIRVDRVVAHCFKDSRDIELTYQVYSSQIAPSLDGTVEGQKEAEKTPQSASGLTENSSRTLQPSNLVPAIGFDSADKLFAGGQVIEPLCGYREAPATPKPVSGAGTPAQTGATSGGAVPKVTPDCKLPLQLVVAGSGSQKLASVRASLRASVDSKGPIAHSDYLLSYNLLSTPTGAGQVRQTTGSLQYTGTSRAFFKGNVNARFGGLLEKGDEQSELRAPIPASGVTASPVNALKLYGGLDSRASHNVLSASTGIELGTANFSSGVQWAKYVGDLHDDFWANLGSGHLLDLETRFTAGAIQASGPLPVAERFFGGNYEQLFMPDDSWQIRANPVIRAISGSRFFETSAGSGATQFIAGNLTAAVVVWRKPLVPDEVRKDPTFSDLLNGQITTATSVDQLQYVTNDESYVAIEKDLPTVLSILGDVSGALDVAQRAHPDEFATQFKTCSSAVKMATNRTKSAIASTDAKRYGLVSALLPVDKSEDRLNKAISGCSALNAVLVSGPAIDLDPLTSENGKIEGLFGKIDQSGAKAKADADIVFVRRTLKTLFNDVNLISISPVAVFDAARIGPMAPGINGIRYGPGGGLRLEFASAVNFTVGYARNVNAGPGEGSGAVFFSMALRDLFH